MLRSIFRLKTGFSSLRRHALLLDPSISEALKPSDFLTDRHIGPNTQEMKEMLTTCKVSSTQDLINKAIGSTIRDPSPLPGDSLPTDPIPEKQYLESFKQTMGKNKIHRSFIGCGFYDNLLPTVIQRNLLENPGWYTSYTPYQGEVSQGRLESLLNYQTLITELTGLEISNASLLDQGTAGAEAFFMSYSYHDSERKKVFVDKNVFIPTLEVIKTRAKFLNVEVVVGDYKEVDKLNLNEFCSFIVQTPDSNGVLHDFSEVFGKIEKSKTGVFKVVATDLLALTVSKNPGSMGADVAFGTSQRFGVPMGYGGPNAAFFAAKNEYLRKLPGRIIGISRDAQGNLAYRMTLQTREQHIRREKATSNICTAQALLANIAAMYAVYHGPKGLRKIGERVNSLTQIVARLFQAYGLSLQRSIGNSKSVDFFDTITVKGVNSTKLAEAFEKKKMNIRKQSDSVASLSFDETTTLVDLDNISAVLSEFTGKPKKDLKSVSLERLPIVDGKSRGVDYLKQSVFNSIHSESQMLRYLANLQAKDLSLNKSMITLGSCTMKLNASSEMLPLTWPEMNIHPFAPQNQALGYNEMITRLGEWLQSVTKFDAISFQPNSGAAGEYTGLLTINQYLRSKGESNRKICLIPKTAHGTNPASAYIAGMKVVPVEVIDGRIDIADLKKNAEKYKKDLGAIMITFPSTAGIYEETVHQACQIIHHYGGQVYMDGANMNAQVGWTSPGFLGADVCHLNLHKTFAIPHGGGGPGAGPIGVRKHLVPYLPSHPFVPGANRQLGPVSSAPYGSASILSISYGYIAMLGKKGIQASTTFAILNANYLMHRLRPYYKILYVGDQGYCGHEFIMDIRPIKEKTGVSEEDIAKRLMDYGFHAPTMSFPTPGTLMIEPTESEDKGQLDRFADALINIRKEIDLIPEVLKHAPYTAGSLLKQEWTHKFTREQAAYPLPWVRTRGKYWPTVSRIDNPYGDKHLICACPEVDSYFDK